MADVAPKLLVLALICVISHVNSQTTDAVTDSTAALTITTPSPINQESTQIQPNTDLAECTCDLTAGGCDVNCCCDEDCSADDRLAFSFCADQYTPFDDKACVRSEIMFMDNTPYEVDTTVPGLFCVYYDNYEERNYFELPETLNSTEDFDLRQDKYGTHSFRPEPTTSQIPDEPYKSGDPVLTLYENNALGFLAQPNSLTSLYCKDTNPASFLQSSTTSCVRPISDLYGECEINAAIKASTYFQGFRVVSNPEFFAPIFENGTETTTANPVNTNPQPMLLTIVPQPNHTCIDNQGVALTCTFPDGIIPDPELDINADPETPNITCRYVAQDVEYSMEYNGTSGLSSVRVRFTFRDTVKSNLPLTQQFTTQFTQAGVGPTFRRSGNPGYMVGEPLLAGHMMTELNEEGEAYHTIELDADPNNWLTMVTSRSAADSHCVDATDRVPVTFGVNMRSGCLVSFFFENMTDVCNLTQWAAWNALRGPRPPQYMASFGNSDVNIVGDWVGILGVDDTPTEVQDGPLTCQDIITGLNIQVVYANVGALDNPQPKILGARYQYRYQERLRYQCIGPYCQPGNEKLKQTFEISSSVEFIDLSQPSVGVVAEIPSVNARLPEDFFYPFS